VEDPLYLGNNPTMRALGVNCDPHAAYVAVVEDGAVVTGLPERLIPPSGLELGGRLLEFVDEVRRDFGQMAPERIGLLLPESNARKQAYGTIMPRVTIEAMVRVAAAQEEIPLDLVARPTVRSRLGLPRAGSLDDHLAQAVGSSVGRYWTTGRGLAALVARAVEVG
jgi:hypothetical protein